MFNVISLSVSIRVTVGHTGASQHHPSWFQNFQLNNKYLSSMYLQAFHKIQEDSVKTGFNIVNLIPNHGWMTLLDLAALHIQVNGTKAAPNLAFYCTIIYYFTSTFLWTRLAKRTTILIQDPYYSA